VRRVATAVEGDPDPYAVTAALRHDAVEKGSSDWAQLKRPGAEADDRLVELVDALTERRGETVHAYLARCAADSVALRVKRADILDKILNRSEHLNEAVGPSARPSLGDVSNSSRNSPPRQEQCEGVDGALFR
jgi:hypothetical protein